MKHFQLTFIHDNKFRSLIIKVSSTANALRFVQRFFEGYKRLTLVKLN